VPGPLSAVYSTAFIKSHGGAVESYTVPDGFIAVIRCITAVNTNLFGVPENAQVVLGHSSITIYERTISALFSGPGIQSDILELRVVVEATDTIQTPNNGADVDMTVSGYLLATP
jgi:hypothetical protein